MPKPTPTEKLANSELKEALKGKKPAIRKLILASKGLGFHGRYRFRSYKPGTQEVIGVTKWINNLVLDEGLESILERLCGITTHDIIITTAEIGTGTNPPSASDTALQTPVLTGIEVALAEVVGDTAVIQFLITDAELANGTYTEFLLRAGTRAFARSLIDPVFEKNTPQDIKVEYQIGVAAV